MTDPITITSHEAAGAGEYRAHVAGSAAVGRLTWVARAGAAGPLRVAEHTLVPAAIGGRGVAARLVEAMVAEARAQGFRIVPACSYVAAWFARHPEAAALRADQE
ncbi:MAG: N-acetyltransferase [Proteobacteria bacterium]|nr:N-acetyltransferase [Pseudomonadota bacterium]